MVSSKGKEGLALLAVVIVVVAALGVAVIAKDYGEGKDNPNGILGTYVVADYAQYGTMDGTVEGCKWYLTDSGYFDDQKLVIESYKDGFVSGTVSFHGVTDRLVGYYDPDTGSFGYGISYSYTPEGSVATHTFDSVRGIVRGDAIYVSGYTTSESNEVAYVFAFTYAKEGKEAAPRDYKQVLNTPGQYVTKSAYEYDYDGVREIEQPHSFNISAGDSFHKGVYAITKSSGSDEIAGMATTVYQNGDTTLLRCLILSKTHQFVDWILIQGGEMHVYETFRVSGDSNYCRTFVHTTSDMEFYEGKEKFLLSAEVTAFSSLFGNTHSTEVTMSSTEQYGLTAKVMLKKQPVFLNFWPDESRTMFTFLAKHDGATYYCDMYGFVSNGAIKICGFAFGANNDVMVAQGTVKVL